MSTQRLVSFSCVTLYSFAAYLYACALKKSLLVAEPKAVSLVGDICQKVASALPIRKIPPSLPSVMDPSAMNFTVCVTPFSYKFNDVSKLVEMIEVNRMFGASNFVFYDYSSGPNVTTYLRHYERQGIAEILPWNLPLFKADDQKMAESEIHYFGQVAALNDCLYRTMFTSAYGVFTDLDELIVPRGSEARTWRQMLDQLVQNRPQSLPSPAVFAFRNTFFRTDLDDNESILSRQGAAARSLQLTSLLKTTRETKTFDYGHRSKYIVVPSLVNVVGVHKAYAKLNCLNIDEKCKDESLVVVNETIGLLHHYRAWPGGSTDVINDETMLQFHDEIVQRVRERYRIVSHGI